MRLYFDNELSENYTELEFLEKFNKFLEMTFNKIYDDRDLVIKVYS